MATAPSFDSTVLDPPPPYLGQEEVEAVNIVRDQPCPNGCETGDLPDYELKKHLLVCPLQLVECEFAQSGCDVRVPRRDLAKHMTESAQLHLMSATLLNLRLTRELNKKMEEKDQQIIELQQQVNQLSLLPLNGFICHNLILTNFKNHQGRGGHGEWHSETFSDQLEGYQFNLQIDTNGSKGKGTHLTAWLNLKPHKYGKVLSQQLKCMVYLKMLNQMGDYNHHVVSDRMEFNTRQSSVMIGVTWKGGVRAPTKFFPVADLCSDKETQYLKNDTLHFKLYLKTDYF